MTRTHSKSLSSKGGISATVERMSEDSGAASSLRVIPGHRWSDLLPRCGHKLHPALMDFAGSTDSAAPPRRTGIIGMGYVGLPLAVAFAEAGHEVYGVEVDRTRVEKLRVAESY